MKKILIIMNSTISLYRFRKELLEALAAKKWQVFVSAPNDGLLNELKTLKIQQFIDTPINRHGTSPVEELKLLLRYRRMIRKIRPDIILTYTIKPNIYGNLVAKSLHIPVISTMTGLGDAVMGGNAVSRFILLLYRYAFRSVSCVVFQNVEDEKILRRERIVVSQNSLQVMGSGVNLEEHILIKYPDAEDVSFLYIGRIMKTKGVELLIDAARRLKNEGNNKFTLTLIGYHEGDIKHTVELAEAEGIVLDAGFQEDIKPFIRKAHCVVLPSFREGMSNALLEAAAFGRPLIATDVSGCREIVDETNGFLCKAQDLDSLYQCMKLFLDLPDEKRSEMGAASRRKVEAEFDRKSVTETILTEINKLV